MIHEGQGLEGVTLHLVDFELALVQAWEEVFWDCQRVTAAQGNILSARGDALVSPANSFGYMDGGLDLAITEKFGWGLEARVRQRLLEEHDGELPVGQAIVVETEDEETPWLVSAPTMRVPMRVDQTANAYLALRAVLRAVRGHNASGGARIERIVCPGLGTGNGAMPAHRCAWQMREAWEAIALGRPHRKGGLAGASRDHMAMVGFDPETGTWDVGG